MINNVFENAKFGDMFITEDEKYKFIYHHMHNSGKYHLLFPDYKMYAVKFYNDGTTTEYGIGKIKKLNSKMTNIFDNVKFGDTFKTRSGDIAIYQRSITENNETTHFLFTENIGFGVNSEGLMDFHLDSEILEFRDRRPELDIVEKINI